MQYRTLGKTKLRISAISFGAGPVSTLMVGEDRARQRDVVRRALNAGVNWFDTAAGYGDGKSEESLGRTLEELDARAQAHVATKVRLRFEDLNDIGGAVRRSMEGSLARLRLSQVALLQLHNSVTARRGDEPTSITPQDVLGPNGVAAVFRQLHAEGLTAHIGLTGIGQAAALREVVASGEFDVMQVPYNLLNPSAGCDVPADFAETNYGNVIAECARQRMGVLAIRVLAGGALADSPPSPHTLKTPFFPLALFERDRRRAERIRSVIGGARSMPVESIRFVLSHPHVSSALIGFGDETQIDEALAALEPDNQPIDWLAILAGEPRGDGRH